MIKSIELGPLSLHTFGLCVALGFLCAGAVAYRRYGEIGWDPEYAYEVTAAALVGGIVGARLWWALGDPSALADDPVGHLVGGSGLTWYGGVIGGVLACGAYARWRGLDLWHLAAATMPALALGYAIGRVGCQISGDGDYGIASSLPWAMPYPDGVVPTDEVVHPTPIYETLVVGVLALVLWHLRELLRPQRLVAVYLVGTGLERFLVEFVRRNPEVEGALTVAQITALLLVAAGTALWLAYRGGDRSTPPPARA